MKKYVFDFNLSCWIQQLEIEADSYEEAVEKLYMMDAGEIIENGYVHDSDVTSVSCDDFDDEDDDEDYDDEDEVSESDDVEHDADYERSWGPDREDEDEE